MTDTIGEISAIQPIETPQGEHEMQLADQSDPNLEMYMVGEDRVATHIRSGGDRSPLRVVAHGKKVAEMPTPPPPVRKIIEKSGLAPLIDCSYPEIDRGLLSAFIERWERLTSSFHLRHGEMTITLDDVASLLHVPVTGKFFTLPVMSETLAKACLMGLLGVSHEDACYEFKKTRGQFVRLSWLRDWCEQCLKNEDWDFAARAYLLHLLGCTLFADKTASFVSIRYLELLRDLSSVNKYAWGTAALAHLYDQLGSSSYTAVRGVAGYASLFQAWIYEHFPNIVSRGTFESYHESMPRARQWVAYRSAGGLIPTRIALDKLALQDIDWAPYAHHRKHWPFENVSLYSGYIRCDDIIVPYLPERVLRQFGYVQDIPRSPRHVTDTPKTIADVDVMWKEYKAYMLSDVFRAEPPSNTGDCVEEYSSWYFTVSSPFLIPLHKFGYSSSDRDKLSRVTEQLDRIIAAESLEQAKEWAREALNIASQCETEQSEALNIMALCETEHKEEPPSRRKRRRKINDEDAYRALATYRAMTSVHDVQTDSDVDTPVTKGRRFSKIDNMEEQPSASSSEEDE